MWKCQVLSSVFFFFYLFFFFCYCYQHVFISHTAPRKHSAKIRFIETLLTVETLDHKWWTAMRVMRAFRLQNKTTAAQQIWWISYIQYLLSLLLLLHIIRVRYEVYWCEYVCLCVCILCLVYTSLLRPVIEQTFYFFCCPITDGWYITCQYYMCVTCAVWYGLVTFLFSQSLSLSLFVHFLSLSLSRSFYFALFLSLCVTCFLRGICKAFTRLLTLFLYPVYTIPSMSKKSIFHAPTFKAC